MKKLLIAISALILCLTAVCASPSVRTARAEDTGYNFVFVCPNIAHEYWTPVIDGMHKADAKLGTVTTAVGPTSYDNWQDDVIRCMTEILESPQKPDGIMVRGGVAAVIDENTGKQIRPGTAELIDAATEKGIPVFTVDTDDPSSKRVAYVGSDLAVIGQKAARALVAQGLAEGSKLGMVMTTNDESDSGYTIRKAFESTVGDYGMKIVDTVFMSAGDGDDDGEEKTINDICTMLTENRNIKALFTTGAVNAVYAAKAKLKLGSDFSDLIIIGQDDLEESLQYVREGVIYAVTAQRTDLMGYLGTVNFKKYLDTGSLTNNKIDTGVTLVTKENVDSYKDFDSILSEETITVKVGYYDDGETSFQSGFGAGEQKSGYAYEYYQAIANYAGWRYEYVTQKPDKTTLDKVTALSMLESGALDIVAGINKTALLEDKLLFSAEDMDTDDGRYFAVAPSRLDLKEQLDYVMAQIKLTKPTFTLELKQKYYNSTSHQVLTEREEQWLLTKSTIKFGYTRHHLPYSDQEDGKPVGLVKTLIEHLGDYINIDIVPVCFDYVADMETALKNNEIDAGFPIYSDLYLAEQKGLRQTDTVVIDRVMIIYKGNYTDDIMNEVAISKTSLGQRDYLGKYYPDSTRNEYPTVNAALDAIQSGQERCIVGCSSVLQRALSGYENSEGLKISYLETSEELSMAVSLDNNILTVILNKYISQMDRALITGTLMQYSTIEKEVTFADFFQKYAYVVVIVLFVFFAILAVVFIFYFKKTKAYNRHQEENRVALEAAYDMAKEASAAKTKFLSSMSHDIRTPMNAIIGMTTIANNHIDDKVKVKDCLDKITLSGKHLLTLINDVLDISKIESGKIALAPIDFSLRSAVDNLVNIVRPMIKAKKQEFDVRLHGIKYETLFADELRVNQIFINILSNAVKYTHDGGKIVLDLSEQEMPGGKTVKLIYVVEDNGMGMSKEFMANMYETFSRQTDSKTNKIQGTGLGLAIVKQMVTIMGGTIECESEVDVGTKFTVTLELPIGKNDADKTLPDIKLLLVDDDEMFLERTKELIESMGATVDTAHSGERALELIKEHHSANNGYDVAIVDWKMPMMSGPDTLTAIRKYVGNTISVILASAYDWSDIEDDVKDIDVDGFISKPLFKSNIYEKITEALHIDAQDNSESVADDNDLKGAHLLIAEDNDLNWEVIEELLDMYEITAERAENGKQCVDMLNAAEDGKYELVLMDIQMPVMNGKEAAKLIRSSSRPYVRNIPIIAMTADAFAEDIAACIQAGMNGHAAKPVDMDKLCQEIRKVRSARQ